MCSKVLEENWENIRKRVILPLWNTSYKSKYRMAKLDYDDFESMAGYELTKAFDKFDSSRAGIYTYATQVIKRKANTELRDCTDRDKRASLHSAESLDVPVSNEQSTLKIDMIPSPQVEDNSNIDKIKRYLMKLSATEKDVVIFKLIGFDEEDIINTLGITKRKYTDSIKSMRMYEKASLLRRRC